VVEIRIAMKFDVHEEATRRALPVCVCVCECVCVCVCVCVCACV